MDWSGYFLVFLCLDCSLFLADLMLSSSVDNVFVLLREYEELDKYCMSLTFILISHP